MIFARAAETKLLKVPKLPKLLPKIQIGTHRIDGDQKDESEKIFCIFEGGPGAANGLWELRKFKLATPPSILLQMAGSWVYLGRDGFFVALMAISSRCGIFCSKKVNDRGGVTYFGERVRCSRTHQGRVTYFRLQGVHFSETLEIRVT